MKDMHLNLITEEEHIRTNPLGRATYAEHIARYSWACRYAKGLTLDLGCGCGYGSFLMSFIADKVIGIDYEDIAIETANEHFKRPNIEYKLQDLEDFNEKEYDFFAMLECLEHVEDPIFVLTDVKRKLKTGGRGIISLPVNNKDPHHKMVLRSPAKAIRFMDPFFEKIQIYFQISNMIIPVTSNEILMRLYPSYVLFLVTKEDKQ